MRIDIITEVDYSNYAYEQKERRYIMLFLAKKLGDITTDDVLYGYAVFFVAAGIICLAIMMWVRKVNRENAALPVQGMEARVVDLERPSSNEIKTSVWIMFEGNSGNRIRVMTRSNHSYMIGDKGYVRWQGTRLYSFERGKTEASVARQSFDPSNYSYSGASQPNGKIPAWMQVEMEKEQQKKMQAAAAEPVAVACPNCGTPRKDKALFCGSCGTKF